MKKEYLIASLLVVGFAVLIWMQYALTSDIRHDRHITRDLELIRSGLEDEISRDLTGFKPEDTVASSRLPLLDDLDLPEATRQRAKDNRYEISYPEQEYSLPRLTVEMCAVFKTDTGSDSDHNNRSYSFSVHKDGRDCFTRSLYVTSRHNF